MTLSRQVIEPKNPALDQSQKFGLPLSPAVRGGDFVFVSGMAAIDPVTGARTHGTGASCSHAAAIDSIRSKQCRGRFRPPRMPVYREKTRWRQPGFRP